MTRRHLPREAGGNPARGPAREFTNEPSSPLDANEFPDLPPGNDPSSDGDLPSPDQPDLERFAERLGIDAEEAESDGIDDVERAGRDDASGGDARQRLTSLLRRAMTSTRSFVATGLTAFSDVTRRLADRTRRESDE